MSGSLSSTSPTLKSEPTSTSKPSTYPRPDFYRPLEPWESLNSTWYFAFDDANIGLASKWQSLPSFPDQTSIVVPYAFQTRASQIEDRSDHEVLWYRKELPQRLVKDVMMQRRSKPELSKPELSKRLLVRFGAVDYETIVFVDGVQAAVHRGGHTSFDVDVTDYLPADVDYNSDNVRDVMLTLRVRDSPHDLTQPRGKQYWKPKSESIWYTPTSGIWLDVWAEIVTELRIGHSGEGLVIRGDDIENGVVQIKVPIVGHVPVHMNHSMLVKVEVSLWGYQVGETQRKLDPIKRFSELNINIRSNEAVEIAKTLFTDQGPEGWEDNWSKGIALWTPETPSLYDIDIFLIDKNTNELLDAVRTYTGMRSLSWKGKHFKLNGKPYFQALVLDQGYWPETGLTPPSPEHLEQDIMLSKAMGFNGCRKHQKVEDPRFLYYADTLGYLVWSEIANAYEFDSTYVERFNEEWIDSVKRDINHPCIVTWTPANESWGYPNLHASSEQRNHLKSIYYLTKSLDPTRPVNENCGWEHVKTDLITFHDYDNIEKLTERCSTLEKVLVNRADKPLFIKSMNESVGEDRDDDTSQPLQPIAPIMCTEFGGLNIRPAEGTGNSNDWGYITADDPEDLLKRLDSLCMGIVKGGQVCAFVYTQLTDIEQEVNGLYTFDRKPKLSPDKMFAIIEKAKKWYFMLNIYVV